jgi:hypothetical protein
MRTFSVSSICGFGDEVCISESRVGEGCGLSYVKAQS